MTARTLTGVQAVRERMTALRLATCRLVRLLLVIHE